VCGKSPASTFPEPRGAYAPRSWLHPRVSSRMRGCALQRRFVCHGGLTPPALGCCTIVRPWKTAFCDAQTHVRRSGGRQPAVVRDTDAVPRESSIVRRPTNGQRRAAGVSPPWFAERDYRGSCIANHLQTRVASHGWLTPAAPGCKVLVTEEITTFAVHKRSFSRAAGVSSWPETVANSAGTPQTRAWFASGRFSMLAAIPARSCNSAIRGAWFASGRFSMLAGGRRVVRLFRQSGRRNPGGWNWYRPS
jgi:hypothetical protein